MVHEVKITKDSISLRPLNAGPEVLQLCTLAECKPRTDRFHRTGNKIHRRVR